MLLSGISPSPSIARPLHARDAIGVDLEQSLYALDSTTIDLCRSLFPWAKFRRRKAAIKMHTLQDLHGNIPRFIRVTRHSRNLFRIRLTGQWKDRLVREGDSGRNRRGPR